MPGKVELKVYASGAIEVIPEGVYIGLAVLLGMGSVFFFWLKGLREVFRCSMFLMLGTSVLFRESGDDFRLNLVPLSSYFDIAENSYLMETSAINILNAVMFIPVGLLSGLGFREMTWKKVLLAGLALSFSIELLQFILKRGLCETDDLIHNVLGCMVGFAIFRLSSRLINQE